MAMEILRAMVVQEGFVHSPKNIIRPLSNEQEMEETRNIPKPL